jgi:S-adenosylmethionine synthetase
VAGVRNVQVYVVSQIGQPIEAPAAVDIQVVADDLESARSEGICIARQVLDQLPNVWQGVMRREFRLY